ncbi:MAG: arginyltransferase [Magnetococcales bacterium]|nr:arginyltransferase [Magnetococcales bacterium]
MNRFLPPPLLHLSPPHPCGYLRHSASTLSVDATWPMNPFLYEWLLEKGFRRSGSHVYRPCCAGCAECLPVRLPAGRFIPQRSLRRVWERNRDLSVTFHPAGYTDERFRLYHRYIQVRHGDGSMADPGPEDFADFLLSHWGMTLFIEFRRHHRLLAVAVTDLLPRSLSAVYTFFDPDEQARSLGSLAILQQIHHAREQERDWLYLGYWIQSCPKMAYKSRFRPMEFLSGQHWQPLT